jgi:nitrogen fixation protein FixH
MSVTNNTERTGFRLTGLHVLAILVAFFGVVFAVNGVMVYLAIGSFPGAATASSYTASQRYNSEIATADAQAARGWQVDEQLARDAAGKAVLTLTVRDKAGTPVDALAFTAHLQHPVKQGEDVVGTVVPLGAGRYAGTFDGVEAGLWTLAIEGTRGGDRVWRSENRVVLR